MSKLTAIAAALVLSGSPAAWAQTQPDSTAAKPDVTQQKVDTASFVATFSAANQFEIDASQLAEEKSSADDVKTFAAQMIKDHTKAAEDFKAALSQGQTTSAVTPGQADRQADMLKQLQSLQGLSGAAFQARYISLMDEVHKTASALFQSYARDGDDPVLKEFAKGRLDTLKEHERMVKELQAAHPQG